MASWSAKIKTNKKNQGIRLVKPQHVKKQPSFSGSAYERDRTGDCLQAAYDREREQRECLERYERGVTELLSIIETFKKELWNNR